MNKKILLPKITLWGIGMLTMLFVASNTNATLFYLDSLSTPPIHNSVHREKQGKVLGTVISSAQAANSIGQSSQSSSDAIWFAINGLETQIKILSDEIQNLGQSQATPTSTKKYKYLLLANVMPCKINQLASDGWQLYQQGDFINTNASLVLDPACKFDSIQQLQQNQLYGLSWAIFQKELP